MTESEIQISTSEAGTRIDVLCAKKFATLSRTQWQKHGHFKCGDREKPSKTKVREGEVWHVSCSIQDTNLQNIKPWDYPLKVLAESKSWVAIQKPIGIAVHPSTSDMSQQTIVNALVHQFGKKLAENFDEIEGVQVSRPGLVHRLDKVTSGVLLVAKTNTAHKFFQEHWKEVKKVYYAIVHGAPPTKGRVEAGIERDVKDRQKMTVGVSKRAKDATTKFECIKTAHNLSLLKVIIPTGRTHQIRVHLSEIGFPILGDEKYGGEKAERVFLHASELTFPDPDQKGKKVTVQSPVPREFSVLSK